MCAHLQAGSEQVPWLAVRGGAVGVGALDPGQHSVQVQQVILHLGGDVCATPAATQSVLFLSHKLPYHIWHLSVCQLGGPLL